MESPDRRTHESGMDFEWANKSGPTDANSPWKNATYFTQYASNGIAKKRGFGDLARENSFPQLREPASSRTHLFSQPPQSASTSPARASAIPAHLSNAFTTPRRSAPEVIDSSDADSTPGNTADSEATPESAMGFKSKLKGATLSLTQLINGNDNPQKTSSGESRSPSKSVSRQYYSHKAEDRVLKRRRKDGVRSIIKRKASSTDDETDAPSSRDKSRGPGMLTSVLSYINDHPDLPHILSWYTQLALNTFLVGCVMYLIYCFWSTVQADVQKRSEEAAAGLLSEMAACAKEYNVNGCANANRPPALNSACDSWQKCMNRDPYSYGRAKVSASMFAEIFNSFVEPISWKAVTIAMILFLGSFAISNMAFHIFRNRHPVHNQYPQQNYYASPPPATPGRQFSGGHMYPPATPGVQGQGQYWNGYHGGEGQQQAMLEGMDVVSPSRRIMY